MEKQKLLECPSGRRDQKACAKMTRILLGIEKRQRDGKPALPVREVDLRKRRMRNMSGFNLPPGCNVSDIPGNRPGDDAWDGFYDMLDDDAKQFALTDVDAMMVWKIGLKAYFAAKEYGARFPHDPSEDVREPFMGEVSYCKKHDVDGHSDDSPACEKMDRDWKRAQQDAAEKAVAENFVEPEPKKFREPFIGEVQPDAT